MFGDRFSSSTSCSRWLHETEPGRLDQALSCRLSKVATHPFRPSERCRHRGLRLHHTAAHPFQASFRQERYTESSAFRRSVPLARRLLQVAFGPRKHQPGTPSVSPSPTAPLRTPARTLQGRSYPRVPPETLRAELARLESRLYRAMLVQAGAIVGAQVGIGGIVVGVLRLFD